MPLIEIPTARFHPCMDSFLGALHGVLVALDVEREMDELWGLSALGLRTQIHHALDPVGLLPDKWDATYTRIYRRLGYDAVAGLRNFFYTPKDLRELQFVWMDACEKALDDGRPPIAFGLHGPAFGIIRGLDTDTEEYHVSTFMDGQNDAPINVQDVGSQNPPLIFFIVPTGPVHDYTLAGAAREALREAVEHHFGQTPEGQADSAVPVDLVSGPAAYNAWSTAVETGLVQPFWGVSYYAGYYAEARSAAATWLRRLTGVPEFAGQTAQLQRAAGHLDHEVECFTKIPALFPFNQPDALQDGTRRTEASACLRAARAEHIAALEVLAGLRLE